jgi:hypothetical protein
MTAIVPQTTGFSFPLIMEDAYVEIGGNDLSCVCLEVSITPEVKTVEVMTFCYVQDYPGPIKWHFTAKFAQSFDANSTHDTLTTAWQNWDGTAAFQNTAPFTVRAHQTPAASPTNPEWTGSLIPQPVTKIGGAPATVCEIDIDWSCLAEPTINIGTMTIKANPSKPFVGVTS